MGDLCYLPLVSGLLRAKAETQDIIRDNYHFKPFIYAIDNPSLILNSYDEPPSVAAFSISMWNERLNLYVAKCLKKLWPDCLIIFGGPQVPHNPSSYFTNYPFIDVAVCGEGEESFSDILIRFLDSRDFSELAGVSWRNPTTGDCIINADERSFSRDLDNYPSPYLEGLFDELVVERNFQAIIETNRGCPFLCTFCYWGRGGLTRKYKYHGLDRVYRELEWCAKNEIRYIFNADSNFGMHKRDLEIAEFLVELKDRTGFPEKFRTCYGKNTDDKIFKIGSLLHNNGLDKSITLARQSNDPTVLSNIKRSNISMDTYRNLQTSFNHADIPIYSELILGLPGETKETWRRAIEDLLDAGLKNQLFIYLCQILPNTDMADPEYVRKFGIKTRRIELTEIHSKVRDPSWVTEYEEIVVSTNSMSLEDWREMLVLSWISMLMHSLKLGYFVMEWLFTERNTPRIDFLTHLAAGPGNGHIAKLVDWFYTKTDYILAGGGRGCVVCGDIYWDVEEAAFIKCMIDSESFYNNMAEVIDVPRSVIDYQKSRIPTVGMFDGNIERWAMNTIVFGRKSGTILLPKKETI